MGTSAVICNIGDERETALRYPMRVTCSIWFTTSTLALYKDGTTSRENNEINRLDKLSNTSCHCHAADVVGGY